MTTKEKIFLIAGIFVIICIAIFTSTHNNGSSIIPTNYNPIPGVNLLR